MEELVELKRRLAEERPDSWEDLPDIPLYMDQVVGYLSRQLVSFEEGDGLTSAMINNYIKDGLLSRANGKKYDQEHLAWLTAISALKQVLSVREMRALVTVGKQGRDTQRLYDFFCQTLDQAMSSTADALDENTSDQDLPKLVLTLALRSYVDGLACRRALAIMAQREGKSDLLDKGRKK
jgi:DNA-binding transcriptional MerR regulator